MEPIFVYAVSYALDSRQFGLGLASNFKGSTGHGFCSIVLCMRKRDQSEKGHGASSLWSIGGLMWIPHVGANLSAER